MVNEKYGSNKHAGWDPNLWQWGNILSRLPLPDAKIMLPNLDIFGDVSTPSICV